MLEKIERTCRQLDQVMRTGSAEEKKRGKAAMAAYGRTLELFRELSELRHKAQTQWGATGSPGLR